TYNDKPVLENNKVRVSVYMRTILDDTGVLWEYFKKGYSSYEQTGYAGLLAQDRCLPLAPLLQSLFHIKQLRTTIESAVYADNEPDSLLAIALLELFAAMKKSTRPVSTTKVESAVKLLDVFTQPYPSNSQIGEFTATFLESLVAGLTKATRSNHIEILLGGLKRTTTKRVGGGDTKRLSFFQRLGSSNKTVVESPVNPLRLNIRGFHSVADALHDHFSLHILTGDERPRSKGIVP
ncbi:ubiquitin-specific protease ubp15, partial [Linderina pennispora]